MITISVRFNHKYVDPLYSVVENYSISISYYYDKCKKLNSLQHLVRTTVAGSHN